MALIRRVRALWTGVAGAPAYSNFYTVNGSDNGSALKAAVANMLTDLAQYVVTPVVCTVQGEIPLIDSVTGEIQGIASESDVVIPAASTGIMLPPATQLVCRWRTAAFQDGRRLQGRTYIPYLSVALDNDGVVDPGFRAQINGSLNEFIIDPDAKPAVWSRKTGAVAAITSGTLWDQFGVMRSRRD